MSQSQKRIQSNQNNTIDEKHTEMLNRFHKIETEIIPELQMEIQDLKIKARSLKENQIDQYMEIKDKILMNNQKIKDLSREKKTIPPK